MLLPVLALLHFAAALPPSGTWTFYSTTSTTTKTVSTSSASTPSVLYTNVAASTVTVPVFTSTIYKYSTTVTSTSYYDTSTVSAQIPTITVTSSPGARFTPIRSAFPYTASVKIKTVNATVTVYLSTVYPSTETDVYTQPNTTTYLKTKRTTSHQDTSTYIYFDVTTVTATNTATSTVAKYAVCQTGGANSVDKTPYGNTYGPHLPPYDGTLYTPHPDNYQDVTAASASAPDQEACCNRCMSDPLCVGGFWSPEDVFGDTNVCQLFVAKSASTCAASKAQLQLVPYFEQGDEQNFSGYALFNGQCGQTWPAHHEYAYYYPNNFAAIHAGTGVSAGLVDTVQPIRPRE